jgi:glutathione reductase (NADPH)
MMQNFDLAVIGTGSAASQAAHTCRAAGWQVAVVDSQPFGGTCALRGCDPKKVLVGVAELVDLSRRMQGRGVGAQALTLDWPELMRFKRGFTDPVPSSRERGFAEAGIRSLHGTAHFVNANRLQVGEESLVARHFVIAAGGRPTPLGIAGDEHLVTSTDFLELDQLPDRIVFVGGGYIALEFAHIASRAGSRVTILHRGERPLERFDADLVERLVRATEALGIELRVRHAVESVEKVGAEFRVHASTGSGRATFAADLVVHAAGRVPDLDDLCLEAAGVHREKRGVVVNEYLQSVSNPAAYAAGDAAASPGLPLTPVAGLEGRTVAANLLKGNHRKADYRATPSVVFSLPPLAAVGLSEEAARDAGLRFHVHQGDTSDWYSSRRLNERHSGFKVLVEEATDQILGAHLLGPHADEVINLFAVAMRGGLPASMLKETLYAYPTSASDLRYML